MLFILDLICGNDFTSRLHYSYHDILSYFINQGKKFSENSKGTMFCGKDGKSQGEQENFV
jgi:hypothetical protein